MPAGTGTSRQRALTTLSALLLLGLLNIVQAVPAAPLRADQIPEELAGWTEWVLYGAEDRFCPFVYNDKDNRRCAWPSELSLDLRGDGGKFEQTWQVYAQSWLMLPGSAELWPQEVTVNGEPAPVTARDGRPAVQLAPGEYTIRGRFFWDALPESLLIPADTGIVQLSVNQASIAFPDIEADGRVWLRARDGKPGAERLPEDRIDVIVLRRVIDEVPLEIVTRLEIDVAGEQRELTLGPALPGEFIPLRLTSPLPARLEPDGSLRLKVRPGRWIVELAARHPHELEAIALGETPAPWPREEIWAFDARPHLRLVEITGVPAVDPRQTRLPQDWQQLPAYLLRPGDTLQFKVIRRGDPLPEPDQLNLRRTLWLDFDGGGYTLHDEISGSVTRSWRLEANPEIELGQVKQNGQGLFITRLPESERRGVEIRRGQVALDADSRYTGDTGSLPATGWDQDFTSVSATLNLPPGWRLFSARGADRVSESWVQRWTLLDIFLVLIAAIAIARLWSWPYGLLALLALTLLWHEPGAPRYVWLNILAAIALLRVLPPGRFASVIRAYRNLSLLALVLIAIPFLIDQVRLGLYPQLERPWQVEPLPQVAPPAAIMQELELKRRAREAADVGFALALPEAPAQQATRPAPEEETGARMQAMSDPDARVQTGPGLPRWQWTQIELGWNGPVARDQRLYLQLVSPELTLSLNLLRVLLVVALALLMFGFVYTRGQGLHRPAAVLAACLLATSLVASGEPARADIPDPQLLEELKTRLLAPPECLPECAQIPRMAFNITPESLFIRLEIHAYETVAVPLPAQAQGWLPRLVNVDGAPAGGLARGPDGELWLQLPAGLHQVILAGPVPEALAITLPLPLKPHRVEYQAEGWRVEGVHENGLVDPQLRFTRLDQETASETLPTLRPADLPPFVRIERTLRLGLDWGVETRIARASPPGTAIVIEVPLLAGESVTTENVRVSDGKVQVSMAPEQEALVWQSVLAMVPAVTLTASDTTHWTEVWRVDVSPIWHMAHSGIAPVHHVNRAGQWLPEWRPWPGESVTLDISRPLGVEGRTLTIDESRIETRPGERTTDTTLSLTLRSSQGGQHTITLAEGMQLLAVTLNGIAQPIRQEGTNVTLPISPGTQTASLQLRSPEGIASYFATPTFDLGAPSVNAYINLQPGRDRWILFTGGPDLGPAVLFWGVLIVILIVAIGLGRIGLTPLRWWHWLLLGAGLTQTPIWVGAVIVGWLLALGGRAKARPDMDRNWFNLMQIGLAAFTIVALVMLFLAVKHGLLGLPEMQIAGNDSDAYNLNWYQDRSDAVLPQAWIFSVSLWVYRISMLAWALWLAFALLGWLKWGWGCYNAGGIWRHKPKIAAP